MSTRNCFRCDRWGALALLALSCAGTPNKGGATPGETASAGAASEAGDQSWRQTPPTAGAPRPFEYPAAQMTRLPNGVQVWLVPRKSGTVALSVNALAGGAACSAGRSGLAALTLRLMTESTQQKTGLQLAEAAETLGANIDFDTGRDGSSVSVEVLPSDA